MFPKNQNPGIISKSSKHTRFDYLPVQTPDSMNDDDSYSFVPCSSKKHLDQYLDFEDFDDNETEIDSKGELPCPFCFEDFDIVGLYCHIDEQHPIEAESGVCPVCSLRVGMNIVGHMTSKHGDLFTLRHKLKLLKSETWSSPSLSRKDSLEGHLESFLRGSSHGFSSPNTMEPDPLSTLIYNPPTADEPESVHPRSLTVPELPKESSESSILERDMASSSWTEGHASQPSPSSVKDQEERMRRCEFVHALLWSTFIDK